MDWDTIKAMSDSLAQSEGLVQELERFEARQPGIADEARRAFHQLKEALRLVRRDGARKTLAQAYDCGSDEAVDVMLAVLDDGLSRGDFATCNVFLDTFGEALRGHALFESPLHESVSIALIVATLSGTKRARSELPSREPFLLAVRTYLTARVPDRAERLLLGIS